MAGSISPKMMAHDIAKGLVHINPMRLKKFRPADLKALLNNLTHVQREVRAKQIPQEEIMEIKEKNRQLQHINQAITIINGYVKKHRIKL